MASTYPPRQSQTGTSAFSIGTLLAGLTGGLAIVSIMGLIGRPLAGLSIVSPATLLWIAFGLLMLGLVFGVARHRWGTGSSTVAHVLVNLFSTGLVVSTAV